MFNNVSVLSVCLSLFVAWRLYSQGLLWGFGFYWIHCHHTDVVDSIGFAMNSCLALIWRLATGHACGGSTILLLLCFVCIVAAMR